MGSVIRFPFTRELTIFPPLDSSPDDEFEAITISDDSLSWASIYQGDIVIIKLGLIQLGGLHAVLTPTGKYVGSLVEHGHGLISLESDNDEYEPVIYRRDEITVLGHVVQVYPRVANVRPTA